MSCNVFCFSHKMLFFHIIILLPMIVIIETVAIQNMQYWYRKVTFISFYFVQISMFSTVFKVSKKSKREKFHIADRYQLPSERSRTYLLTMFPAASGDHAFIGGTEQEWQIQRNTNTNFSIYGMFAND